MKHLLPYHNKILIHESLKKDGIYQKEKESNKIDSEKKMR